MQEIPIFIESLEREDSVTFLRFLAKGSGTTQNYSHF